MKLKNRVILSMAFVVFTANVYAWDATNGNVRISVSNILDIDRTDEIVSIDLSLLDNLPKEFVIRDSCNSEVPHQKTYDNKLIFPVSVPAYSERTYVIEPGFSSPTDTLVYGRLFPERLDDFAWENDISAYRFYGPAFQNCGAIGYGYDIWTKSVPYPVIESRYRNELNKTHSYHVDDGTGMDVYEVGASLGAGATALLESGNIVFPTCFEKYEILDNGPLRFTVRFSLFPNSYKGKVINETRIISLDKGALFNKAEISYDTGLTPELVIAGISVKETAPDSYTINPTQGFVTYEEPTEKPNSDNGVIYLALIAESTQQTAKLIPVNEKQSATIAHACLEFKFRNNSKYDYYWGGCWHKRGISDLNTWNKLVERKAKQIRNPLIITINNN